MVLNSFNLVLKKCEKIVFWKCVGTLIISFAVVKSAFLQFFICCVFLSALPLPSEVGAGQSYKKGSYMEPPPPGTFPTPGMQPVPIGPGQNMPPPMMMMPPPPGVQLTQTLSRLHNCYIHVGFVLGPGKQAGDLMRDG